jgi:hypothetical protein
MMLIDEAESLTAVTTIDVEPSSTSSVVPKPSTKFTSTSTYTSSSSSVTEIDPKSTASSIVESPSTLASVTSIRSAVESSNQDQTSQTSAIGGIRESGSTTNNSEANDGQSSPTGSGTAIGVGVGVGVGVIGAACAGVWFFIWRRRRRESGRSVILPSDFISKNKSLPPSTVYEVPGTDNQIPKRYELG